MSELWWINPSKGTQFNRKSDWSNKWIGHYYWSNHAFSFIPIFRLCLHFSRLCPHFYRVSSINYYAQIVFMKPKGVKIQKLIKSETDTLTPYFSKLNKSFFWNQFRFSSSFQSETKNKNWKNNSKRIQRIEFWTKGYRVFYNFWPRGGAREFSFYRWKTR